MACELFRSRIQAPDNQKRLVLMIVSIALLLDKLISMVVIPIIPIYLRETGAYDTQYEKIDVKLPNGSILRNPYGQKHYIAEDEALGVLFASKSILQVIAGPIIGILIDRVGDCIPLIIGLTIMFVSTSIFAIGQSYGILFLARSVQGVGVAFLEIAAFAMIADRFNEQHSRSKAFGVALVFASFGYLVAPPFGGFLYEYCGKVVLFIIMAILFLVVIFLVLAFIQPRKQRITDAGDRLRATSICHLLIDPYIICCSGALMITNVSLAFLEPTISLWMKDTIAGITEWKIGLTWLPAFLPHVIGICIVILLLKKFPKFHWLLAAVGLVIEGLSCFGIPFCTSFWMVVVVLPLAFFYFGIAFIVASLLPLLGYLVDSRHVSIYGSVYAIANIAYNLPFTFGPIAAGEIMSHFGFFTLNLVIGICTILYAPVLLFLLCGAYARAPPSSVEREMETLTVEGEE